MGLASVFKKLTGTALTALGSHGVKAALTSPLQAAQDVGLAKRTATGRTSNYGEGGPPTDMAARTANMDVRAQELRAQAAAGGAQRIDNAADLLGSEATGPKRRNASRTLLG